MESSFLQQFATLLQTNAPTKEEAVQAVQKFENLFNGRTASNLNEIPNLKEFGSLLREVIPDKYPKKFLDKADLKLTNVSNFGIRFDESNGNPVMESGNHVQQASNCMNVTNYDKLNWLLLSCTRLMNKTKTINKTHEKKDKTRNKRKKKSKDVSVTTTVAVGTEAGAAARNENSTSNINLDQFIDNLNKFVDSPDNHEQLKENVAPLWKDLENIIFNQHNNNNNNNDGVNDSGSGPKYWLLRLALLFYCKASDVLKLSFVKDYALTYKSDAMSVSERKEDIDGANGTADENGSEIKVMHMKERLDYLLKPLMLKLGSFLDICQCLTMISSNYKKGNKSSDIMLKFVAYYHYFDKDSGGGGAVKIEHFLFSMKYEEEEKTLLNLISQTGDLNLLHSISKFSLSTAVIDEMLMKYSDYINDMFNKMRNQLNQVQQTFVIVVDVVLCLLPIFSFFVIFSFFFYCCWCNFVCT